MSPDDLVDQKRAEALLARLLAASPRSCECLGGPVTDFHPIGTRGVYEWARVDLSRDTKPGVTSGGKSCFYGA